MKQRLREGQRGRKRTGSPGDRGGKKEERMSEGADRGHFRQMDEK